VRALVRDVQASGVSTLKASLQLYRLAAFGPPRGNVAWGSAQVSRLLSYLKAPS